MENNYEAIESMNETLSEMEDTLNINPLLEKAHLFMENTDEGTCETLRETLSITAQRKLVDLYVDFLVNNTAVPLSPTFQEKLDTYLLLSSHFEGIQNDSKANCYWHQKSPHLQRRGSGGDVRTDQSSNGKQQGG